MTGTPGPGGLFGWLDRRYGLRPLVEYLRQKEVPIGVHSMAWYYLGGATLFFFILQVLSGVLLLAYYQPGEATAYESVRFIATKVPFGWLMRSVHAWSAHLMVLSVLAHMFSTMLLKAYRPPRELTWVTGILLLGMVMGFGFSGYLLPWNELAYYATTVGTNVIKSVPLVGQWTMEVLRGGPEVSAATLYRFFALHVVVFPLAIGAIIAAHLLMIQRQGMAPPVEHPRPPRGLRFLPDFLLRDLLLWLVLLIVVVTLAVFLPYGLGVPGVEWELGNKADPLTPAPPGIKPEWYFLWTYQLLKEFPPHVLGVEGPAVALLVVGALIGVWTLVPWLDRRARRNQASPAFTDLGVAAAVFVGHLTLEAWDIGAGPEAAHLLAARNAAWISLSLGAAVTAARIARGHRYYAFSAAALLQIVLHGLVGISYLLGGVAAVLLAAAWVAVAALFSRRSGGEGR